MAYTVGEGATQLIWSPGITICLAQEITRREQDTNAWRGCQEIARSLHAWEGPFHLCSRVSESTHTLAVPCLQAYQL